MKPLLDVRNLSVEFDAGRQGWGGAKRVVSAVDGVSLSLNEGEILGVVGESGCGKTTLARSILGLTHRSAGAVTLDGRAYHGVIEADTVQERRAIQMVFQDPFDSLNPRKTVFQTLAQPLRLHSVVPRRELRAEAHRLLELVGLSPAANYLDRYPHQFSGGQRQRIGIARAIAPRPRIVIADEAVSALDVSIRAQILRLMRQLQKELKLSYLFITHDLGVVRSLCDRVLVMYLGRVVEEGPAEAVLAAPGHPYTRALIASCPIPDPARRHLDRGAPLAGEVPSPLSPPPGCRFHTRCPIAGDICRVREPTAAEVSAGQRVFCHFSGPTGEAS